MKSATLLLGDPWRTWRLGGLLAFVLVGSASAADPPPPAEGTIRVATYNVAMYRNRAGQLAEELRAGTSKQAEQIAEVLQRVRPDIVLLCEIDHDPAGDPAGRLAEGYAAKSQSKELAGVVYPHGYSAPVNTGMPSGLDLDLDGRTDGPNDAWGYGRYEGQYGMAVLSRFPIEEGATRTFQNLLWSELPVARAPVDPKSGEAYYPAAIWKRIRLPSKSFWDVEVRLPGGQSLHLICSHPTPPVFDGPEDRNGCRNADEVRLVREYVSGQLGDYFIDDSGRAGALPSGAEFVVLGDLNADPNDGNGRLEAIRRLIASPRMAKDPQPASEGAVVASEALADLNASHVGDSASDTGNFGPDGHGNLRIDYALPSKGLEVVGSGVYWPKPGEPGAKAIKASDHRLVWIDIVAE